MWVITKAVAAPRRAFGVDPHRPELYSLRQSRYDALAQDVSDWASEASRWGQTVTVLDIGCGSGVAARHLQAKPYFADLILSGADVKEADACRKDLYRELFRGDLTEGYPQIASDSYDVVICEQVLEHLSELDVAIATLERVLKPGGRLIVGVPIFVPPLAMLRRHAVPVMDRLTRRKKQRGHVQAFTLFSFLEAMRAHSNLTLRGVRGFRIISGGVLRPLENFRWWWKFNRRLGAMAPALCIEIQAILEKPRADARPTPEEFRP